MTRETWRSIAVMLGERMEHHAYCPSGSIPGVGYANQNDVHRNAAEFPDCPFCRDREAYRRFRAKLADSPGQEGHR